MVSKAMRQLEERHMATKVDLVVWSNKMDLLALSNAKGEVTLHRLSWQKVWSLPPPQDEVMVKGIAWRPDGKVVAVGYSNGEVLLIDVENKDILHKAHYGNHCGEGTQISFLCWPEEKGSLTGTSYNNAALDSASTYLPKLPPISRTFGSISEETNEVFEDTKKVMDQTNLNFLLVGFSDGTVAISVFGLFPCGVLDLPDEIKNDSVVIVGLEIAADLKNLFVVVTSGGRLRLVVYDTDVVASYCREIHALAYKHGLLMSLMDYLGFTMHSITEAYENMLLLEMESKLSQYAESLPEGTVSADFLELLMFGITSDPLETFLLQDLTDKGIKKLGHSIELSHSNIQKLILKHLQAVGQNIAYHLSELRGMARLTERVQILGIDENMVAKGFEEIGAFLVKASEVQLVIDDSMKKYKALFKWLYAVILRVTDDRMPDMSLPEISQQETAFIADYLYHLEGTGDKKKHCFLDKLGQYMANQELTNIVPSDTNPWEKLLQDNPCLANNTSVIVRDEKLSLVQQHQRLKKVIKNIFSRPKAAIGSKIQIASCMDLAPVSEDLRVSLMHIVEENKVVLAFIPRTGTTSFTFMEILLQEDVTKKVTVYFKSLEEGVGLKTVDLQFYTAETLSVLLEQPGEDRCAVFVQVPVRSVREARAAAAAEEDRPVDAASCLEAGALRPIDNMVACRLAVSGTRKVAVLLSENRHKVRTFEMEVEEDEEEEDMETTRESDNSSLHQSI